MARLHERLKEVRSRTYEPRSEAMTVGEIVKSHIKNNVAHSVEPETVGEYEERFRVYIEPHLGGAIARWALILKWAAYTGMRKAEICGLTWGDIDFASNTAYVRQVYRRGRFKVPKTEHSIRTVQFPAALVIELKAWKLQCPKGENNPHDLVFPTEDGNPQNPSNLLQRGLYPALRRAGLRKITLHGLRHSYATLTLAAGENLGPVSRQLGHANVSITQTTYRHVLPSEGKGLSDRLHTAVKKAATEADAPVVDKLVTIEAPEKKGVG